MIPLYPNEAGLTFVSPSPDGRWPIDGTPLIDLKGFDTPPTLSAVTLVIPSEEVIGLVRYVQKLGTNRGAWREVFEPQSVGVAVMSIPSSEDLLTLGREVYESRCVGLPRRQGRRQWPGRDLPRPRAPQLHARRLQVPHDAVGIAAHRRRPLPYGDARSPLDGDAHLA